MTMQAMKLFADAFNAELAESQASLSDYRVAGKRPTKANPDPAGEDENWWRAEGPQMVQAWMDWRASSKWRIWTPPNSTEPAIELGIETEVAGLPLRMVIDRVMVIPRAETLCIVDLKTGARTPESDLQLGVYRLGLRRAYNIEVNYGAFWMARKGKLTEIVNLVRFDDQMLTSWFDSLQRAIENRVFIPHLTSMCRACGLNRYCAAYGGADSHMDPDSPNHNKEGNSDDCY